MLCPHRVAWVLNAKSTNIVTRVTKNKINNKIIKQSFETFTLNFPGQGHIENQRS